MRMATGPQQSDAAHSMSARRKELRTLAVGASIIFQSQK
jgi:hypothetical protein